jgi:hypothetical protein
MTLSSDDIAEMEALAAATNVSTRGGYEKAMQV